jgi:hypothetical protein
MRNTMRTCALYGIVGVPITIFFQCWLLFHVWKEQQSWQVYQANYRLFGTSGRNLCFLLFVPISFFVVYSALPISDLQWYCREWNCILRTNSHIFVPSLSYILYDNHATHYVWKPCIWFQVGGDELNNVVNVLSKRFPISWQKVPPRLWIDSVYGKRIL